MKHAILPVGIHYHDRSRIPLVKKESGEDYCGATDGGRHEAVIDQQHRRALGLVLSITPLESGPPASR